MPTQHICEPRASSSTPAVVSFGCSQRRHAQPRGRAYRVRRATRTHSRARVAPLRGRKGARCRRARVPTRVGTASVPRRHGAHPHLSPVFFSEARASARAGRPRGHRPRDFAAVSRSGGTHVTRGTPPADAPWSGCSASTMTASPRSASRTIRRYGAAGRTRCASAWWRRRTCPRS